MSKRKGCPCGGKITAYTRAASEYERQVLAAALDYEAMIDNATE